MENIVAAGGKGSIYLNVRCFALIHISSKGLGDESVVHVLRPELHQMFWRRGIIEVYLSGQVPHSGMIIEIVDVPALHAVIHIHLVHLVTDHHLVAGVGDGGVREECIVENVVPAQRREGVSPTYANVVGFCVGMVADLISVRGRSAAGRPVFIVEDVSPVVSIEIQAVTIGDAPAELAVEVVEEVVSMEALRFQDRGEEHRVHAASADRVGEFILYDWPFEMQAIADGPHAHCPVRLLHVAVVCADIDDGGDAAAVSGRKGSFVEGHLLHRLRLEYTEDAQQVLCVVEGDAVKKKQVLLRASAPYVDA